MWHFRNINRLLKIRYGIWALTLVALVVWMSAGLSLAQTKSKDASGGKNKKFVNKIPYDVFFDNPLQVVNSNKNTVTTDAPAEKSAEPKPNPSVAPSKAKSGVIAWQELLPIEELQAEVKTLRNGLTKAMANPGKYNDNFKAVAIDGAEIAALAVIVQQHGESLSWKDKAQYVRDFGAQLNKAAVARGKENFEKTKAAYERLSTVLDGSIPADAGEVVETRPFEEVAPLVDVMKRIEKAKNFLKQDVNNEAKFKSMSGQIQHEAGLIAALSSLMTIDYSNKDDVGFQTLARLLIDGAQEALNASKEEVYEKFSAGVDKMNKSCSDCHSQYR